MNSSLCILIVTGLCAIAATFLAWVLGGKQEDVASAIGGVTGFILANGLVFALRGGEPRNEVVHKSVLPGFGCVYSVFAMFYFAFVGWLAGYVHDHGALAGTVCGGLGGYILAVSVPAIHRSPFMAAGRKLQLALSVVAFCGLLTVVWVMYKHEFL